MEDPESVKKDLGDDESLANVPPAPVQRKGETFGEMLIKGLALLGIGGAAVFVLLMSTAQTCRGATRSAKLKWQERQAAIDEALHDANANGDLQS